MDENKVHMHLKHPHLRPKSCVSGAAETTYCGASALEKSKDVGREIVRQGAVLVTGATTGVPLWSAIGAKEEGGVSIGLSPASTEAEHVNVYQLPLDFLDLIIFTGFGYSGRNLLLTRSSDAVIIGCGRIGTINELTIAFEDGKPIGILRGEWETDEVIENMLEKGHRPNKKIIFDDNPKELIRRVLELVKKDKEELEHVYQNYDGIGGGSGERVL